MRSNSANFAATLGVLVSVATSTLWIRSYLVGDAIFWSDHESVRQFSSIRGTLGTALYLDDDSRFPSKWVHVAVRLPGEMNMENAFLVRGDFDESDGVSLLGAYRNGERHVLLIPHWMIALVCAAPLIGVGLRRAVRRRRSRRGLCCRCGYDLRASPERCPECGWSQSAVMVVLLVVTSFLGCGSQPRTASPTRSDTPPDLAALLHVGMTDQQALDALDVRGPLTYVGGLGYGSRMVRSPKYPGYEVLLHLGWGKRFGDQDLHLGTRASLV